MHTDQQQASFQPKMPFHMVWLATNACTARCMHCSSNSTVRARDEMATQEVYALIDQFVEAGVVDLAISGGEPLTRKDIVDIIAYAKSVGMSVGLGSNGAKLTARRANSLAESGLDRFQVSLDGFADAHDKLRCWPGLFNRALGTIEKAHDAGLRVHVCCTINRLNVAQLEGFTAFVSEAGVHRLNVSRYIPTGRGTDALDLTVREWEHAVRQCAELRTRYKGKMDIVTHLAQQILVDADVKDMPGFRGCQAGSGQACVTANGTVYPCVLLPLALGNVRRSSFLEIWTSSSVVRSLQRRDQLKGTCATCSMKDRCGGCRAVAYAKSGDYLASDPRCWLGECVN